MRIIKLNRIKPVDKAAVLEAAKAKYLYFLKKEFNKAGWQNTLFLLHDTEFKGVIM